MSEKTRQPSRTARVQPGIVNSTRTSLQDLPEKAKETISLQEAVRQLRAPLKSALGKGYSYQELATLLQQHKISIRASTLKSYLTSGKQDSRTSSPSSLSNKSSENLAKQSAKPQKTFLETAQSLNLQGVPDWSEKIDQYLYGDTRSEHN